MTIPKVDISKGTMNASLAVPREIFRPAIIHSAYGSVLVHNHPSGATKPSEADRQITKRVAAAAQILGGKIVYAREQKGQWVAVIEMEQNELQNAEVRMQK